MRGAGLSRLEADASRLWQGAVFRAVRRGRLSPQERTSHAEAASPGEIGLAA
jgi:hypothetical protein